MRSLDLFLHDMEHLTAAKTVIEYLANLLKPLPIAEVGIALHSQGMSLFASSNYGTRGPAAALRALDTLLCSFSRLRRVTIRQTLAGSNPPIGNPRSTEPVGGYVRCEGAAMLWRNLPELRKRGILRVE
ncbi:uncharacterized protein PHACADRAFT_263376 [Phanerochaete carnosa HHB-10118-sp]|uniref:Uncharacterized protein n=1 Tax=Phanerochaete carnosa (strain HHB-10118-sp) TaxID=650164 RepID=K5VJ55_PHACS|nr:uncharacterized protein PHACADRAFT_263376 [Phanerochaete carnosa HHB-10118-sp]EKM51333.1 hypothetical protein PHACADRAFT_263376 [Phanerochaete carnosa HHB-10118-sp]